MAVKRRYLVSQIRQDLARKMVFVAGPRQVGKTTLALGLPGASAGYLSWDVAEHRERILKRELPPSRLWVFDEIHKYRSWRNLLKRTLRWPKARSENSWSQEALGWISTVSAAIRFRDGITCCGSTRSRQKNSVIRTSTGLSDLLKLGGFPEPFLSGSEVEARRWSRDYRNRLVREEVAGLERIQDLGNLELLALRLPELVGSPLSINALREDLQLSHKTVDSWLQVLERLYAIFRLSPFGAPRIRAVKKEQKHYQFDWSLVPSDPARFENLIASHLLKWVHFEQDARGRGLELRYFRDTDGREVDFVVVEGRRPQLLVECKWGDTAVDRGLRYLKARFPAADAWQISATGSKDYLTPDGIRVSPALALLERLI